MTTTKKKPAANPTRGGISLTAFLYAIAQKESGNYGAVNPDSGALGKYQVLPSNVPAWSAQCLGYPITAAQFLASPKLQERIVRCKLGGYFRSYGPAGAAAAWYSGDPNKAGDTTPQPGGYPSVASYVQDVYDIARRAMHLKPQQLQPHPPAGGTFVAGGGAVAGSDVAYQLPGGGWDPLNWIAGPVTSATGAIITSLEKLTVEGLLVLAGVGIIVVGAFQSFQRDDDTSGGGVSPVVAPAGGGKAKAGAGGAAGEAAELAPLAAV